MWEPNRDIDGQNIFSSLDLLSDTGGQDTVASEHLHFEQAVEAILSSTRVKSEFGVACLLEIGAIGLVKANVSELLLKGGEGLVVPLHC